MPWWAIVLVCLGSALAGGVIGYAVALFQVGQGFNAM